MNIKNRSDLTEFPDGGRATLVRRYSPALTKRQLDILRSCPYETPGGFLGQPALMREALALVRLGLLERDPSTRYIFRVTEAGADVVHRWESAGWAP